MGARQEFFKEELAGSIQRRIFKAELKGESMIVSPRMKLIIPLVKFSHVTNLLNTIHDFDAFDWSHNRQRNGTLCYGGYPVAERITDSSFYFYDDWQIYHRYRKHMSHMGWVEMNDRHEIVHVFNYLVPLGFYGPEDCIELIKQDRSVVHIPLPSYDEAATGGNGILVETTKIRGLAHCEMKDKKVLSQVNIPGVIGVPVEKIGLQGNCVKYPTKYA